MEYVRGYYNGIIRLLGRKRLTNSQVNIESIRLANEALDGIKNKLLSMQKDSIPLYAKFIVDAVNNEVSMFEYRLENELNFDYLYNTLDLDCSYQRDYTEKFPIYIIGIFADFGVKIQDCIYDYDEYYFNFEGLKLDTSRSENVTEPKISIPEEKTQKLGAPSVKTRVLLIKALMEQVYGGFGKLDDTVQMRFINSLTGIDKNVKNILNGSIKPAFNAIKKIENGLDTEGKAIDSYNETIDEASSILESIGIEELSNELKKKKIS